MKFEPMAETLEEENKQLKEKVETITKSRDASQISSILLFLIAFILPMYLVMWCWLPAKWDLERAQAKLDNSAALREQVLDTPIAQANILHAWLRAMGYSTEGGIEYYSAKHGRMADGVSDLGVFIRYSDEQEKDCDDLLYKVWLFKSNMGWNHETVDVYARKQRRSDVESSLDYTVNTLKEQIRKYTDSLTAALKEQAEFKKKANK